jgi:hypothetical protein
MPRQQANHSAEFPSDTVAGHPDRGRRYPRDTGAFVILVQLCADRRGQMGPVTLPKTVGKGLAPIAAINPGMCRHEIPDVADHPLSLASRPASQSQTNEQLRGRVQALTVRAIEVHCSPYQMVDDFLLGFNGHPAR